jgi:hypothetical protein
MFPVTATRTKMINAAVATWNMILKRILHQLRWFLRMNEERPEFAHVVGPSLMHINKLMDLLVDVDVADLLHQDVVRVHVARVSKGMRGLKASAVGQQVPTVAERVVTIEEHLASFDHEMATGALRDDCIWKRLRQVAAHAFEASPERGFNTMLRTWGQVCLHYVPTDLPTRTPVFLQVLDTPITYAI